MKPRLYRYAANHQIACKPKMMITLSALRCLGAVNAVSLYVERGGMTFDAVGNVIAGEARLLAARELGMTEVPTLCLDHLTPAQLRAFRIADNRLSEIATWDAPSRSCRAAPFPGTGLLIQRH